MGIRFILRPGLGIASRQRPRLVAALKWAVVAALLVVSAGTADGAIITIAGYAFASNLNATTTTDTVTTSSFTYGSGASGTGVSGGKLVVGSVDQSSESNAYSNGDYVGFTITPTAGYYCTLTSFNYDATLTKAVINVQDSITGFSSSGGTTIASSTAGGSITLGTSYQNLTTATTFRLYDWRASGGGNSVSLDNVYVMGTRPRPGRVFQPPWRQARRPG